MTIALCETVTLLREHGLAWRAQGKRIALVPTMGALHAGHLKLVEAAREQADRVIVTIFVNPRQFAPTEDFSAYPRSLETDCAQVAAAGADLVYAPDVAAMYPPGFATTITLEGPATVGLEDRFRPTHFAGVATIVAKLLLQALTDVALFGEKDFQQLRVIERMARDLDLQTRILGVETVREGDGLALSSRNAYLSRDERVTAPVLHETLVAASRAIAAGGSVASSLAAARDRLEASGFAIDYVEARDAETLVPLADGRRGPGRLLAAARLGRTRLIDNIPLTTDALYRVDEKSQGLAGT